MGGIVDTIGGLIEDSGVDSMINSSEGSISGKGSSGWSSIQLPYAKPESLEQRAARLEAQRQEFRKLKKEKPPAPGASQRILTNEIYPYRLF